VNKKQFQQNAECAMGRELENSCTKRGSLNGNDRERDGSLQQRNHKDVLETRQKLVFELTYPLSEHF